MYNGAGVRNTVAVLGLATNQGCRQPPQFQLSRLATIMAISLQKRYAKSESGMNLLMYDVY